MLLSPQIFAVFLAKSLEKVYLCGEKSLEKV